jgi:choice-of-anchor B domain-containing protein
VEGGKVLVFRRQGNAWREAGALRVAGMGPRDGFGRSLALGDGFAAVGAANRDSATGVVYVFPAAGDGFGEPTAVPGFEKRTGFGAVIATMGNTMLVSVPAVDQGKGAVAVMQRDADGTWRDTARIVASDGEPRAFFGSAVAVGSDELWIGAQGAAQFRGAVYRFVRQGDAWVEAGKVEGPDPGRFEGYGSAVALGAGIGAAGLPNDDYGLGAGAIFTRAGDSWQLEKKVFTEVAPLQAAVNTTCTGAAAGFPCSNVDLVAFVPLPSLGGERGAELNDIWGWTDPETGKEYALVGRQDGTSFVDLSDPENPVLVGVLPRTEGVPGSVWRDIKVYKDHAFIVADGADAHGMQVFDLTRLRGVSNAPATFTPETTYHNIHSAHNIVINEDTGFAYTVGNSGGGETCGGGLHMIDIRDPRNPTFAGCFSDPSTGRQKTGYTHDAQCVLYHGPDEEYRGREICFGSNETALSIADVTDKAAPVALSMAEYPNVGYTHQAWLTEDHHYLLMDDELDELNGLVDHTRTLIWDVSDLDDPVLIKEFLNPNNTSSDHNQYVLGDKVFQSNYVGGLRVIDISDIQNPYEAGFFDTVPWGENAPGFDGSWSNYPYFKSGVIVVTSGDEGLFLLKYRPAGDRPIS